MKKKYRIDFDGNLLCVLVVTENGIVIEGALNGWGDSILLDRIKINELTKTAPATDTGE